MLGSGADLISDEPSFERQWVGRCGLRRRLVGIDGILRAVLRKTGKSQKGKRKEGFLHRFDTFMRSDSMGSETAWTLSQTRLIIILLNRGSWGMEGFWSLVLLSPNWACTTLFRELVIVPDESPAIRT